MKKPHPKSCVYCKYNHSYEIDNGYGGCLNGDFVSICEGRKGSIGNLKHFPFKTEQICFKAKGE